MLQLQRRQWLAASIASLAGPWAAAGWAAPAAGTPLHSIAERFFDGVLDEEPFWASALGMASAEQASRIPMTIAPAQRRRRLALTRRTLAALARINRAQLGEADQITYDVLHHQLQDTLAAMRFPDHLLPLNQLPGVVLYSLASAAENALSPFKSVADHEHHLKRLRQVPAWCEQAMANLREGMRRRIVQPAAIIQRLLPMLRALADPALERSPFLAPLQLVPESASEAERQRLAQGYRDVVGRQVIPAVARLAHFVERDYLPQGRSDAGIGTLPDGKAWYAHCVRSSTTTALTPAEIHELGLREVQRLRGEMAKLQAHYGFEGSLEDFLQWHGKRPEAHPFKTEQEVLDAYAELNRRIVPQLPRLFGKLPKAQLEIRPEPELTRDSASDHYAGPAPDGSRPGIFYAVIRNPRDYATPRMATLFLHEGQPGHHYQSALAQELPLTRFQRFWWYDAYGEGWALYAETLGYPLGLYEDPNARLGHLALAMMRAVRLVVDTGMHDQGWSRERAIGYLMANTGFPEPMARAQIERYMVSPGQALSYAVGRMKIEALRDTARAALGERFSLAAFHDQVLGSGALPLAVLEAKIARWIARA